MHWQQHTLERPDGARLFTVVSGSGPTVVLAHGYLLEHGVFDEVAARLTAQGYRVIAFDQRGHGRSHTGGSPARVEQCVADYAALLAHYAVREATLVAHSMGSFLALQFLLREPELARAHLARLVCVGGNAGAVGVGSLQNRLQIPLLKSGLIKPLWRFDPVGLPLVRTLFGPGARSEHVEATRAILLRQELGASLPLLHAMLHDDLYPRLGEIALPTTVLSGDCDRTCPRWHSERLGSALAHGSTVWLPNVGHMVMYEAPEAIVRAVVASGAAAA